MRGIRFISNKVNEQLKSLVISSYMGGINSYADLLAYDSAMNSDTSIRVERGNVPVFYFKDKDTASDFLARLAS